jgi:iron complex transport system ATP-binding protein
MTSIETRSLCVTIDARPILRDVSVKAPSGSWLALIGPNGAGKTTLLRAVAGLIEHEGELLIAGTSVSALSRRERARAIAVVPQRPVLPLGMTVGEYVLLGRTPHLNFLGNESLADRHVAQEALDRLGIMPFARRPLGTLSGGEQQRVVLARALAQRAPILLLDEGTSALDIGSQQSVLELVESMRRSEGSTVLSAMHDLTLAGQFADRLALIDGGSVVASGAPEDVLNEAIIQEHYNARVSVMRTREGIFVVPRRAARYMEAER